jgi:hypothetical protein
MFLQLHQGNIKMFLWYNSRVWMALCSAQAACWMTKESGFCFISVQEICSLHIWGPPIVLFIECWGLCPPWYRGWSVKLITYRHSEERTDVDFKWNVPLWGRLYKFRKSNRWSQHSSYTCFIALHLSVHVQRHRQTKIILEKLPCKIPYVFDSVYACVEISTYIFWIMYEGPTVLITEYVCRTVAR